jgi:23S rRNA pseudouridine2605 synthase
MQPITQFVAQAAGISRRAAEAEVRAGKVRLNGAKAPLGSRVDPTKDKVEYGGRFLAAKTTEATTVALYKPVGYVSSRKKDETDAPTVMELLPPELQHLKPVGRLDKESEGLLLLTDDGDLLYRATHPKFQTAKEYLIEFAEYIPDVVIEKWRKGIKFPEGLAKADIVERKGRKKLLVVIHQGFNRQLRRMAGTSGAAIISLIRVRSGEILLGTLKAGKWRAITPQVVSAKKTAKKTK